MLRRPCITEREKWNSPSEVTHYPYYSIALLALGCAGAMPGALVAAGAAETETGFLTLIHTPQAIDASGHAYAPARGAHTPLGHLGAPPPTWSVISPVLAWGRVQALPACPEPYHACPTCQAFLARRQAWDLAPAVSQPDKPLMTSISGASGHSYSLWFVMHNEVPKYSSCADY